MKRAAIILLIISSLLAGCHVITEDQAISAKSAAPKIVPGVTSVTGTVLGTENKPVAGTPIHFAQVFRENDSAAFLFDAGNSPSVISGEDGSFTIGDLAAGEYVLVVGDPMSTYAILSEVDGSPKVLVAQGGETLDMGLISVLYP